MSVFTYPATFQPASDGRILVEFPDLPRVATDGKDDQEDLSIRLSLREEIPVPSPAQPAQRLVPVPLWLAPKLALHIAMLDLHVNNSELARRLGIHERAVRRLLDPAHASKPEKIQTALAALGKKVTLEVSDAA
jgi:antitoxin HicB